MSERKIQGDGRPFGIPIRPPIIMRHAEVLSAIESVRLGNDAALAVTSKLLPILGKYLGQKWQAKERPDHAASLRTIVEISTGSAKLANQLKGLKNEHLVAIEGPRHTSVQAPNV